MKAPSKQKSATELYQELSVLHQQAGESPSLFLWGALNLKQQIIFVSNVTDGSIKYEPSLVQRGLVSIETVVLRRWGSDTRKFGLSTEFIM